ncbi:NAD(P)-dependent oxidoreductase [Taibaiella sp. KBW10]|uniref:NAD-dependent epimerase/dehydratase family protein n=1 Tax=Taibaiella sp. KBW10 TaxID=2153357 RepID=UPI0018F4D6BF|nr:NAD-dependent epimerase/dehydratase family protein [Taibaiella sp. KBW10]
MILVTGANGFLGKYICAEIPQAQRYTLSRNNAMLNIDLRSPFDLPDLVFEHIIHTAGKAHMIPNTKEEEQAFFDTNVTGTAHLLAALEELPQKPKSFTFISSVAVYGCESGQNIKEDTPLAAESAYGKSKILAEKIIQDWCTKHKVICTILRLPLLVGHNAPGNLARMQQAIQRGTYFNIYKSDAHKSMVLASDVAQVLSGLSALGGIYNLTDGIHPSFKALSEAIALQSGKRLPLTIPRFLAKSTSIMGNFIPWIPLNTNTLKKITTDLTYNDDKARQTGLWNPHPVLDFYK